jgi:hypothetical protein
MAAAKYVQQLIIFKNFGDDLTGALNVYDLFGVNGVKNPGNVLIILIYEHNFSLLVGK